MNPTFPFSIPSGTNLEPYTSGASNLGSPTSHFGTIYVDNIVPSITVDSSLFVHTSGATMSGDLVGQNISATTLTAATILLSGNSVIVSGNSLGAGLPILAGKTGNNLLFNSVSGVGSVVVSSANNVLTISGNSNGTSLGNYSVSGNTLLVPSGGNIVPTVAGSGVGSSSLGDSVHPFSGAWAGNIPRAWVNFSGSTSGAVIIDSYNVKSVVRTNVGNYYVYFNEPFSNTKYGAVCYIDRTGGNGGPGMAILDAPISGSGFFIQTAYYSSFTVANTFDSPRNTVLFYGH